MKYENLILVMARASGSRDISKQNLRLINGKPLIYYVLRTLLTHPDSLVVVTTDSNEIVHLARHYGVETIVRPKSLTRDSTTMEDIARHSLKILKRKGYQFKKCLIINPHFPLISPDTLHRFFDGLNKTRQTIFGFEQDSIADDMIGYTTAQQEQIVKINLVNRKMIRIKKILSFMCERFMQEQSFAKPYFGIKIPSEEIFMPRNYHNFATLESILNKKKILVRVDGSTEIGLGHVYNMLTILNHFRKEEILVVMNKTKKMGFGKFREYLYNVKTFSSEAQLMKIIRNFSPDLIINDILDTSTEYMSKLRKFNCVIVNFEDRGKGSALADLLFNPIYQQKKNRKDQYYGWKYSCVRDEFRIWQRNTIRRKVEQVFVSFGGTDPRNMTRKILDIISKTNFKQIKFKIILGIGNIHKNEIKMLAKKINKDGFRIEIVERSDFLAQHVIESDFAITSNGRTVFEVAASKVPIISIAVNQREKEHSFVRDTNVGFSAILDSTRDNKQLNGYINKMMEYAIRKKYHNNLENIDLLHRVELVKKIIYDRLEQFSKNDSISYT